MASEEIPKATEPQELRLPQSAPASAQPGRLRFLRGRTAFNIALALSFLGACIGAGVLLVLYHWPRANVPVYYFTSRPAVLWFTGLLPFLGAGVFAVRTRWVLCGAAVWLVCFCACDDLLNCVKPFRGRATERFESAHMAFQSFMAGDHRPQSGTLDVPLRIVTWNVATGVFGADGLAAQFARLRPDCIFMQEFGPAQEKAIQQSPAFAGWHLDQQWQFAVLSRFPVRRIAAPPTVVIHETPFYPFWCSGWEIEVEPGAWVTVLDVHLQKGPLRTQVLRGWTWSNLQEYVACKRRELLEIRRIIDLAPSAQPVVVLGDFNVSANYPGLEILTGDLKECFMDNGYGWGKTAPARRRFPPGVRVDMIFVPRTAKVFFSAAVRTRYSDHYGMLAEVSVPVPLQRAGAPPH